MVLEGMHGYSLYILASLGVCGFCTVSLICIPGLIEYDVLSPTWVHNYKFGQLLSTTVN